MRVRRGGCLNLRVVIVYEPAHQVRPAVGVVGDTGPHVRVVMIDELGQDRCSDVGMSGGFLVHDGVVVIG